MLFRSHSQPTTNLLNYLKGTRAGGTNSRNIIKRTIGAAPTNGGCNDASQLYSKAIYKARRPAISSKHYFRSRTSTMKRLPAGVSATKQNDVAAKTTNRAKAASALNTVDKMKKARRAASQMTKTGLAPSKAAVESLLALGQVCIRSDNTANNAGGPTIGNE